MRTFGKPRKVFILALLATVVLLWPTAARADLITIDFNTPAGTWHLTDQYRSLGVVFSGYPDPRILVAQGSISLDDYCGLPGYIRADFLTPVDFVSMQYQPFEGLADLSLELYNASGVLVGSQSFAGAAHLTWYQLSVASGENVSYALFRGISGGGRYNAVVYDNLTFNTTAVPEPASLLLLGTGLLGAVRVVRRKRA